MKLPITRAKAKLIERIRNAEVLVVLGETGSGKTTQIPKYILKAGIQHIGKKIQVKRRGQTKLLKKKMIAITQPRRVAAISIAKRVATELDVELGGLVGYSVRFDNKTSKDTLIKYMTDGMLLRESIQDPNFNKYSFIIIDEAHERTVNTDLILGLAKRAQERRSKLKNKKKHLKIIIMSATIDIDHLQQYFPNADMVYIRGRQHKVRIFQTKHHLEDYCFATISTIIGLHDRLPLDHHILAFLTGQGEIDSVVKYLKEYNFPDDKPMKVYPLSASISYKSQNAAIDPAVEGYRKVVVSTNIAETSLTIPGIRVVIDCGYVKAKFHNPSGIGLDMMKIIPISQAQVWQRCGRAGRECDGSFFRLYSGAEYEEMPQYLEPEIKRVNLAGVLLYLYKLGFDNPESFDWIDPPSDVSLAESKSELVRLGALDITVEPARLTELGSQMAGAPLSPIFSKILIVASDEKYSVQRNAAIIIAMLASDNIFLTCDTETQEKRKIFYSPYGDLISYFLVFKAFSKSKKKKEFCRNYKLNFRALKFVQSVTKQLLEYCESCGLDCNNSGIDPHETLLQCVHSCLPQNMAFHVSQNTYRIHSSKENMIVTLHPSSSLLNRKLKTVSYIELQQTPSGSNYIKHLSYVDDRWVTQGGLVYRVGKGQILKRRV